MTESSRIVRLRSTDASAAKLLLSLAFVVFPALELSAEGGGAFGRLGQLGVAAGWACVAVFSCIAIVGGLELFRPTTLVVSDAGIELRGQWAQPLVPWEDISEVVVFRQTHGALSIAHLGVRLTEIGRRKHRGGWRGLLSSGRYDRWLMSRMGQDLSGVHAMLVQRRSSAVSARRLAG